MFVALGEAGAVPVIAPLGITEEGQLLNINADTVAGDIAKALSARHFLLLTDVPGVQDKDGDVLPSLTVAKARQLVLQRHDLRGYDPQSHCLFWMRWKGCPPPISLTAASHTPSCASYLPTTKSAPNSTPRPGLPSPHNYGRKLSKGHRTRG